MEHAAAVWWFTAPDMSQGKAGHVPWYVRGMDAASCSALPDPGCSRGSLSAGVVRTRFKPQFSFCSVGHVYLQVFFCLCVSSSLNFPLCRRKTPLAASSQGLQVLPHGYQGWRWAAWGGPAEGHCPVPAVAFPAQKQKPWRNALLR